MPSAVDLSTPQAITAELARRMITYRHDPLGHVLYSYPWGHGDLAGYAGPRKWQREVLDYIGSELAAGRKIIRVAIRSGNGVGKTTLISWICNWALSTLPDTRVNLTAETEPQLRTKTWPELAKWHTRFFARSWFRLEKTCIRSLQAGHEETWRLDRMAWSESNPESFAGLHNARKRLVVIMDEASAIATNIFETAEGAWTDADTEIICLVSGNPTRNSGYFFDLWHKYSHLWKRWEIDARTVEGVSQEQIQEWIKTRGEDSDWVRVHVRGVEPKATELQYISQTLTDAALANHVGESQYKFAPKIIGVDPAWTGGDEIAVVLRQGLASWLLFTMARNDDDSVLGGRLAAVDDEHRADAVFIDQGYGTGVYSYGKMLGRRHWQLVSFAGAPTDPYYQNKRAEMWGEAKQWLKDGGCLPDRQMAAELTYPEAFINRAGKLQLESKDDLKARGLPSPGRADALALTFARKIRPKSATDKLREINPAAGQTKYDPFRHLAKAK